MEFLRVSIPNGIESIEEKPESVDSVLWLRTFRKRYQDELFRMNEPQIDWGLSVATSFPSSSVQTAGGERQLYDDLHVIPPF